MSSLLVLSVQNQLSVMVQDMLLYSVYLCLVQSFAALKTKVHG